MTEDHKALMQEARTAIEALLEEFRANDLPYGSKAYDAGNTVSNKLRKALMKPASKPVAWRWLCQDKPEINYLGGSTCWDSNGPDPDIQELVRKAQHPRTVQYFWDGPPPNPAWVGLTMNDIDQASAQSPSRVIFARNLEVILREKNHG